MKTIFLDQNQFSNMYDKKSCIALEKLPSLLEKNNLKLVLSDFSLYEISKCNDEKKVKICCFIEKCQPHYLLPFFKIACDELKSFIEDNENKKTSIRPIVNSLSEYANVLGHTNFIFNQPLHEIITDIGKGYEKEQPNWMKHREKIQGHENLSVNDTKTKLLVGRIVEFLKEIYQKNNIEIYNEKAEQLIVDKASLFDKCPSIYLEEELFYIEYTSAERKLDQNDFVDMQHICRAGAYCDYFVTDDKHLKHNYKEIIKTNKNKLNLKLAELKIFEDFSS